jgi:site-specific DNA-methyltransferase (adenine-specific)
VTCISDVLDGNARYHLVNGDCLDVLRTIPDCSVDSIVDDPPAGIFFMGAAFDSDRGGRDNWIAWMTEICRESLRVLKPGGYLVCWELPRTSHWTATAVEDAGFEIRDVITHVFGSGFPKSLNLSLAIDKKDGLLADRQVVHQYTAGGNAGTSCAEKGGTYSVGVENSPAVQLAITRGATEKSRKFDGVGTAMKPASEQWIVARKPLIGTLVDNALMHGTGGLQIDACRVTTDWNEPDRPESWKRSGNSEAPGDASMLGTGGTGIQCHPMGRWPANFCLTHDAECRCVGAESSTTPVINRFTDGAKPFGDGAGHPYESSGGESSSQLVYDCVPGCPVKLLDEQSGESSCNGPVEHRHSDPNFKNTVYGLGMGGTESVTNRHADSGGASRFFNTFEWQPELDDPFIYLAKPSTAEREIGCENLPKRSAGEMTGGREDDSDAQNCPRTGAGRGSGGRHNHHPTLKSIALMTHLIKLVTPPGGITLSRFLGSGTDACAAVLSGFRCIGIEKEPDYFEIAKARVAYWSARGKPGIERPKTAKVDERQTSIFDLIGVLL